VFNGYHTLLSGLLFSHFCVYRTFIQFYTLFNSYVITVAV